MFVVCEDAKDENKKRQKMIEANWQVDREEEEKVLVSPPSEGNSSEIKIYSKPK